MFEVAKIQFTKSSNSIEVISTNDSRIEKLMNKKVSQEMEMKKKHMTADKF